MDAWCPTVEKFLPVTPSRALRVAGAIHHVTVRRADGAALFRSIDDRCALDAAVGALLAESAGRAHAYCWMTNHVHLAVEIDPSRAGAFQERLARALGVTDPQAPPPVVDAQAYLLELVRYIHRNPLDAGLVRDPVDYRWSGHGVYLGRPGVPWLCTDHVLRLLGGDLLKAVAAYAAYVGGGIAR
ncbi:MAG: hypothetical protein FJ197_03015 [Gammaproteobacteria bacterium]|nr:hypothetical protein [Gammaproteobacteria bacterium]